MLYRPETAQKFDTTIQVDILGWKTISLRMGGQVEYPVVDLDIVRLIKIIYKLLFVRFCSKTKHTTLKSSILQYPKLFL